MNKKVFISIMVVAILAMLTTACSGLSDAGGGDAKEPTSTGDGNATTTTAKDGPYKIGNSICTLAGHYYEVQNSAIEDYLKEQGNEVISTNADGDINKQISDIEDLIAAGVDGILLNTYEPDAVIEVTQKAKSMGIPVVCYDNEVSGDAGVTSTIVPNNLENGKAVGSWLYDQIDGPIKAVIVSGAKGSIVGQNRRDGLVLGLMEQAMAKKGNFDFSVEAQIYSDWLPDIALKNFQDVAVSLKDKGINCVLTEADDCGVAVIKVLEEMGIKNVAVGSASDGSKYGMDMIASGATYACGINNPALIGETACDTMIQVLKGEPVPALINTPIIAVNKDNLSEYEKYAY